MWNTEKQRNAAARESCTQAGQQGPAGGHCSARISSQQTRGRRDDTNNHCPAVQGSGEEEGGKGLLCRSCGALVGLVQLYNSCAAHQHQRRVVHSFMHYSHACDCHQRKGSTHSTTDNAICHATPRKFQPALRPPTIHSVLQIQYVPTVIVPDAAQQKHTSTAFCKVATRPCWPVGGFVVLFVESRCSSTSAVAC